MCGIPFKVKIWVLSHDLPPVGHRRALGTGWGDTNAGQTVVLQLACRVA